MTKLQERIEKYKIPPIPYLPAFDRVLVWRLTSEEKTAGGLWIPDEHKEAKDIGVLLAAGLRARDGLADHLIEVGDVCWFGRFAGTEKTVKREAGESTEGQKILTMRLEDINGSVDALERVKKYRIVRVADDACDHGGQHFYELKE